MKPTKENMAALKKMGFQPEGDDLDGWWIMKSRHWSFILECVPNIKELTQRLIKTHYNYGYDDGANNSRRKFRPNDH